MPSLQFSTSSIEVNILWHIIQQINIVNFITPALYILIRQTFQPSRFDRETQQFGMPTHGHGTATHGKTKNTNKIKNTLK